MIPIKGQIRRSLLLTCACIRSQLQIPLAIFWLTVTAEQQFYHNIITLSQLSGLPVIAEFNQHLKDKFIP